MNYFYLHKLGCPKNDVDADYIAGFLRSLGMEETGEPGRADMLIVNSCGFIQPAKEESIEAVLSLAGEKGRSEGKKLVITGCLSQRYADQLQKDIPELDGIFGLNDIEQLKEIVLGERRRVIARSFPTGRYMEYDFPRAVCPEEPFAYIKISDGCDNRCSYCAIPDIRGPFRSRREDDICREAEFLLENGKRELILVSQESTAYGRDHYGKPRLIPLLERLSALGDGFWLRILYMHPARIYKELVEYIIDNRAICNYFDVPLQHVNDDILRAMGRRVDRRHIEEIVDTIRSAGDRSAIRTNFIVGFPGETEAHFEELYRFVEETRFDRLGAFEYSSEEGTKAADCDKHVDAETISRRYHRLMERQREIAFERNEEEIGFVYEVIVDTVDEESGDIWGRTRFDAPEIDQAVRLTAGSAGPGDIIRVVITGCDGYDLMGERAEA